MPRKRSDFGANGNAKLVALTNAGWTAKRIAAALTADGVKGASVTTVGVRMQEIRGFVKTPSSPEGRAKLVQAPSFARDLADAGGVPPEPTESFTSGGDADPLEPPTDDEVRASLAGGPERVARFVDSVEKNYFAATDPTLRKGWSQVYAQCLARFVPAPPADPNENPDFVALGKQVAERLHKMVEIIVEGRDS